LLARTKQWVDIRSSHLLNFTVKKFLSLTKFIDNLTKEQFSGVSKRPSGVLSASRDTLNPLLNT